MSTVGWINYQDDIVGICINYFYVLFNHPLTNSNVSYHSERTFERDKEAIQNADLTSI